jgi:small conductance mechanosensitive channel
VEASELCQWVYIQTGKTWMAEGSYLFLLKPLRILLFIALAILARFLIHGMINRLVRSTTNDSSPTLLTPLRERVPGTLLPERRRQRAEALGSVLRSIASAGIFASALMWVLAELSINLAPLLASAGIVGLAIGFGAQNLVKDFVTGMFMLLEDQYGVGDVIDVGTASGTVEAVGLRITTLRDSQGVVWYIRNGEILKVGNKSQGWAQVVVDMPVGFAGLQEATELLRSAAAELADDPQWNDDLIEDPQVLGVEQITADGAVLRTTVKTTSESQWRVGRELRRRLTEALDHGGIAERLGAGRVHLRPAAPDGPDASDSPQAPDGPQQPAAAPGSPEKQAAAPPSAAKTADSRAD